MNLGGFPKRVFRIQILILLLGLLTLTSSTACKKKVPAAALDPTSVQVSSASAALDSANRAYFDGQYGDAITGYEEYLNGGGVRDEEVLLRLSISYVLAQNGIENSGQALTLLQELSERLEFQDLRHPQIAVLLLLFEEAANLRRDVRLKDQKIKEITNQLQKLKEIDSRKPEG